MPPLINPLIGLELLQFQGGIQEWYTDQTRAAYDDFINGIQAELWILSGSGSGTVSTSTPADSADHPGIIEARSGAGAADAGMMAFNFPAPPFFQKTGITEFRSMFQVPILSDGTDRFIFQAGISDALITGDVTDGVYYEYSDNINGGNWTLCTALAGVRTKLDSGVPVVAGAWAEVGFRLTAAPNPGVVYFIENANIGSISTNVPIGVDTNVRALHFKKTLGTSVRRVHSDYFFFGYSFRPGR